MVNKLDIRSPIASWHRINKPNHCVSITNCIP